MSSSAAHQKAAAAAPVEEEAGEHGPFPIEQLQVRSAERPSRLPPPQSIRSFSAAEAAESGVFCHDPLPFPSWNGGAAERRNWMRLIRSFSPFFSSVFDLAGSWR